MSRRRLNIRFASTLSFVLLLACTSASAAELRLRAFNASYDLHKGSRHVATTELGLQRDGEHWRWSSLTRARGLYAWFVLKKPYTRTRFSRHADGFRLHEILITDRGKKKKTETANLDWDRGEMEVLRKGERRRLRIGGAVYDYQSIHLLAAIMQRQGTEKATIDFYHRGGLVKSSLVFSGREQIEVNGESIDARVYEQDIARSRSKIRYYYDSENPLLPLRIETLEDGEKPALLSLRRVEWNQ